MMIFFDHRLVTGTHTVKNKMITVKGELWSKTAGLEGPPDMQAKRLLHQ
jgi:hypothetical protein